MVEMRWPGLPDIVFGFLAHGNDALVDGVHCDNGRLIDDDALGLDKDQRVRSSQIDRYALGGAWDQSSSLMGADGAVSGS